MDNDKFLYQLKISTDRENVDQVADEILGLKVTLGLIFRLLSKQSQSDILRQLESLQHPSLLKIKEELKQFTGN